ncbi:MAG: alpha-L-rhamnosidase [Gemmatimonadales bacterium]|nr:alpha-L-rhamnosidase [Gemmatimonadales bacterium]NIN09995.1 alpha-L-rhamnosidase [Gemmatimonadales bacterium]NIR01341.1 alpha-L-rhamnosidase [Gemmatimonadales bacterium]NIS65253.1 alpha-L-rhamnosidase [Gemmatimonadales bacterium]
MLPATLLLQWIVSSTCEAQSQAQRVFDGAPAAFWIFHPDIPGDQYGVFHFRRVLGLDAVPDQFVVHVSADNRYRLFVNGQQVAAGPQRSDLLHWRYQTVDLAPHLRAGDNVLAALVWNWGPERPVAQFSYRSGFLLQGNSEREAIANTDRDWKVLHNAGYEPIPIRSSDVGGYYAAPPGESLRASLYPWGWEEVDYQDETWSSAATIAGWNAEITRLRGMHQTGEAWGWHLVPRSIPAMEERMVRYATVRRASGVAAHEDFLDGRGDLRVPPHTSASIVLDQSFLTNAYAVLRVSGGSGSRIALTYAEALKDDRGRKGNRDTIEGKSIAGVRDIFLPDGGADRRFQTLWFRTYRYVQMDIETAEEPLHIHDVHGIFTAYPFEMRARFVSDVPWLSDMWEVNWRALRLCAFETYFDTPYYEQLQYVGDTRIQALISLYMSDDDRLVRQAISHFDLSRIPEGITASRYPSDLGQYIPTFSLIWIAMVHDYWMHRDDAQFVRRFLPGIRSVLSWFERHLDGTGMVGPLNWWPFVDWADEWETGVPPGGRDGHSTVITLQFVYALDRAAEIERALGLVSEADRYHALADSIRAAVRRLAWDAERGLFRDAPDQRRFSQQTNTMALLVDAHAAGVQHQLMERILTDTTLTQATYYFGYYVLEALARAGLGDRYVEQLEPWRTMLAMGLTTTPERPEPTRSDSHAWSAHPNYGLLATVLGIRPAEPGFRTVRIAPQLGPLRVAGGTVPHPLGSIDVALVRHGDEGLTATVALPTDLRGVFEWRGEQRVLQGGEQTITFQAGSSGGQDE